MGRVAESGREEERGAEVMEGGREGDGVALNYAKHSPLVHCANQSCQRVIMFEESWANSAKVTALALGPPMNCRHGQIDSGPSL